MHRKQHNKCTRYKAWNLTLLKWRLSAFIQVFLQPFSNYSHLLSRPSIFMIRHLTDKQFHLFQEIKGLELILGVEFVFVKKDNIRLTRLNKPIETAETLGMDKSFWYVLKKKECTGELSSTEKAYTFNQSCLSSTCHKYSITMRFQVFGGQLTTSNSLTIPQIFSEQCLQCRMVHNSNERFLYP